MKHSLIPQMRGSAKRLMCRFARWILEKCDEKPQKPVKLCETTLPIVTVKSDFRLKLDHRLAEDPNYRKHANDYAKERICGDIAKELMDVGALTLHREYDQ